MKIVWHRSRDLTGPFLQGEEDGIRYKVQHKGFSRGWALTVSQFYAQHPSVKPDWFMVRYLSFSSQAEAVEKARQIHSERNPECPTSPPTGS